MFRLGDIICAVATPPGMGGIGILRLSGPGAIPCAARVFSGRKGPGPKREVLLGRFQDPGRGEILDEGLLLVMPGPQSYTAEDVVELHAHGSPALLQRLMEVLVAQGARPAEPGEFTYRAFVNGRLDLAQAEAVEALVGAQGEGARRQALKQLTGGLSSHLEPLEEGLKDLYLKVEARLEFSEDGIPPLDEVKFASDLGLYRKKLEKLLESYGQGRVLREGLTVALLGPPNAGKSSLLNLLLGRDRAIVTPIAGTTRDVVEGDILLKGVKVRFFDTAGIRESKDLVEVEGIKRSRQVFNEADLVFWLVDASRPQEGLEDALLGEMPEERTWYLWNKMDLIKDASPWRGSRLKTDRCLGLSCATGQGLEALLLKVEGAIQTPVSGEDVVLTSARHKSEVETALQALGRLEGLIRAASPRELWAEELKAAALALGRVRGRNLPATAFEEIFTKFCIGK